MVTRREFLKTSSLVALAPTVPAFLQQTALGTEPQRDERLLVVIQLDGGNDGINTVVPFADEGYAKYRKALCLRTDRLLKLNDSVALHPSMRDAVKLIEDERLAIVQGVGYPNPNRSHDVSMAIWQTARLDREELNSYGWIGRALDDTSVTRRNAPDSVLIGDNTMPTALRGRKAVASSLDSIDEVISSNDAGRAIIAKDGATNDLEAFIRRQTLDAYATADLLRDLARTDGEHGSASYPRTRLANRLELIAQLIKADLGTRVYYAVQPGYDTHSEQLPTHFRLLRELAGALKAFVDDLKTAKLDERVLVLCFSEFGRRVKENASAGTDHGTAGPVFLAGPAVRPGVHGQTPSLMDLAEGDVKHTVDFRSVYATVLEQWLGVSSKLALAGKFSTLPLLR
jgi:uncharacterized protein (DUF1501 family)